ncbi:hypothetical protein EXIGLDRAFT_838561 [Exidia glandulosa HHB12029]|uniref:F-box domain-containing protein n=1 Tax=Exidia glandulosa HHB12029 TaxID=1314781 RepID=A0A165FQL4_EXIGL|nr:hypothetical protein EXIGLDRAFT_838561 [Exidia glandulosa HHB12029]
MVTSASDSAFSEAVKNLLRGQFEQAYLSNGPYFEESTHDTRHTSSLEAMESLRTVCLGHLSALHSEMRLRLSARVRVNQLPQDVLIHIFSMLSLHEVVQATHVCHYWWKLGTETASLWTNIVLRGKAVISVSDILLRSKGAQVDLNLTRSRLPLLDILGAMTTLGPHMRRIRSLTIVPGASRGWREPEVSRGGPAEWVIPSAPRLQRLHISWSLSNSWDILGDRLTISVAPRCAPADFPVLRHISLRGAVQYVDFVHVCHCLVFFSADIPVDFPMSRLLALLSNNPTLRHLDLHFPGVVEVPESVSRPWDDVSEDALRKPPLTTSLISCRVVSGDLDDWGPPDLTLQHERVLLHVLDHDRIPLVTITCSSRTQYVAVSLIQSMQTIRHMELVPKEVKIEDDRGFVRRFLRDSSFPIPTLVPALSYIYSLRLSLYEWTSLSNNMALGMGELECLEEIEFDGPLWQCDMIRNAVACPRLRRVTFVFARNGDIDWGAVRRSRKYSEDTLIAIGVSLCMARLACWSRPLERLTICGEYITRDADLDTIHTGLFTSIQLATAPPTSRLERRVQALENTGDSV